MSGVILVRHAMPEVKQGVASKLWELGDAGREDGVLLAHALPPVSAIWSSDEIKARQTAEVLSLRLGPPVQIDAGFAEADRPNIWDRDYKEVAAGYLRGVEEEGWEPREMVVARFAAAMHRATAAANGDIVVVDHGLAMTLWLGSVTELERDPWWRELTLPDAWRFDFESKALEHVWLGGARG